MASSQCVLVTWDDILALLTPDEIADALRFVDVWKKAGHMSHEEADEWRQKIEAWARFRCARRQRPRRFNLPAVEPATDPILTILLPSNSAIYNRFGHVAPHRRLGLI